MCVHAVFPLIMLDKIPSWVMPTGLCFRLCPCLWWSPGTPSPQPVTPLWFQGRGGTGWQLLLASLLTSRLSLLPLSPVWGRATSPCPLWQEKPWSSPDSKNGVKFWSHDERTLSSSEWVLHSLNLWHGATDIQGLIRIILWKLWSFLQHSYKKGVED